MLFAMYPPRRPIPWTLSAFAMAGGLAIHGLAQLQTKTPPVQTAQSKTIPLPPEFDVASIKLWAPKSGGGGNRSGGGLPPPDGGHLQFTTGRVVTPSIGVTAKRIILEAYRLNNYQVSGGPQWIDSDMFQLEAKSTEPTATEDQLRLMLRTLLSKRFHLVTHYDTREAPVYTLTAGKNGPRLQEWKESNDADAAKAAIQAAFAKGAVDASITTMRGYVERMNNDRTNLYHQMTGIDRPVLDKTGLGGVYLFALRFSPEDDYKAIVESQLGLKFKPQKAAVKTLVIDRIEKPDPN